MFHIHSQSKLDYCQVFVCSDGVLSAHQCVLAKHSQLLKKLFLARAKLSSVHLHVPRQVFVNLANLDQNGSPPRIAGLQLSLKEENEAGISNSIHISDAQLLFFCQNVYSSILNYLQLHIPIHNHVIFHSAKCESCMHAT